MKRKRSNNEVLGGFENSQSYSRLIDAHNAAESATIRQTNTFLGKYSRAATLLRESDKATPLHLACGRRCLNKNVIEAWFNANPVAILHVDDNGLAPLQVMLKRLFSFERGMQTKFYSESKFQEEAEALKFILVEQGPKHDSTGKNALHHICELIACFKSRALWGLETATWYHSPAWSLLCQHVRKLIHDHSDTVSTADQAGYTPLMRVFLPIPEDFYMLRKTAIENGLDDAVFQIGNIIVALEESRLAFLVGVLMASVIAHHFEVDELTLMQRADFDVIRAIFEGATSKFCSIRGVDTSSMYPQEDSSLEEIATFQTIIVNILGVTLHPRDFQKVLHRLRSKLDCNVGPTWLQSEKAKKVEVNLFHLYFQSLQCRAKMTGQISNLQQKELFPHMVADNLSGKSFIADAMRSNDPIKDFADVLYKISDLLGNIGTCWAMSSRNVFGQLPIHVALMSCGVASSTSLLLTEKEKKEKCGPDRLMLRILPIILHSDRDSCLMPYPAKGDNVTLRDLYPFMMTAVLMPNMVQSGCLSSTFYLVRRFIALRSLTDL